MTRRVIIISARAGRRLRPDTAQNDSSTNSAPASRSCRAEPTGPRMNSCQGADIHGAIIARELRIPCVNGIAGVVDLLQDGDLVTVDGYLGIVTVGPPDFDLEIADRK